MQTIATTNTMLDDTIFTKECLEKMIENKKEVKILHEFNNERWIGTAFDFKVEDDQLKCKFNFPEGFDKKGYLVPSTRVDESFFYECGDKTFKVYKDAELMSIGLVCEPRDKTLEPI